MDLGVYCLYLAIGFFRTRSPVTTPLSNTQFGWSLWSRCLDLPRFSGCYSGRKNITSHLPAEIYTKTGTLTLNAVAAINQARFVSYSERSSIFRSRPAHTKCKKRRKPLPLPSLIKSQLLILNGYKQLSRSMKPSTRCVKALEYNLRMKKEWKNNFHKAGKDQLETLEFDTFTEIQEQIFSPIYEGENVLGISPTGNG